jgi:hypothetical protein
VQVKPLFERFHTYQRFLAANKWAVQSFPNFGVEKITSQEDFLTHLQQYIFAVLQRLLCTLEPLAKMMQLFIINQHKTSEEVQNHRLAFHPYNYRTNFTSNLKLILKKAGLLTKV